ncbi:type VI secretion system ATPase TssH [Sphingomonas jatrophae]|uniref:Type VI secretion system protein VasG n=1 Tax=Sphingomonas jatrophae TaxID=1166337 RepID=A0A1I6M2A8_9SPHN|nr:type VI secretion system ATPase TssH [Sphingomonas jatrophae]SFS09821.1 type VI secretion system protein VasG [Sphingomonas jatrophae]
MNLKSLIDRLVPAARDALERAAAATLSRTNYDIEPEHWLVQLIDTADGRLPKALADLEVEPGLVAGSLNTALDGFKTGNGRAPALSPRLVRVAREAWLEASIDRAATRIDGADLLLAMLRDREIVATLRDAVPELKRLSPDALSAWIEAHPAAGTTPVGGSGPAEDGGAPVARSGKALDTYCIDLTQRARDGGIDPVIGRDDEIRQLADILTRRRQNNPILTGEAGVGKTAVVEGFALRIVQGDVPPALANVRLLSLDLGLLQAGAGVRGEFENRLKAVIEEVKASPVPLVMFIDEAHSLVGAGGAEGQGDAANLLKPALARGELRSIAATTWAEYKKYFEKDAALSRRFQVVKVEEPSEPVAIEMMRGLTATLERHHGVRILDEAVSASVTLSHRYLFGRQLPDKSISLLDTACARVAMSQAATPAAIEGATRRAEGLTVERGILAREAAAGTDHAERLAAVDAALAEVEAEQADLRARWEQERTLVAAMIADRDALESADEAEATRLRAALAERRAELAALAGERPMVFDVVDMHAIAEVVSLWTGIPVGRMMTDALRAAMDLEAVLGERIRGQDHALTAIGRAVRVARAGLADPRKPTGVFLLVGLSGVGKTETALALADTFYGGAQNLTIINMSEFKEEHKVSMLLGAPPGYVGYGEGGVLTEAVRRKPFSIILLDEMEKAHPGVQDVFYQIFDAGRAKDGQGRDIDFRNAMIVMTSNAGSETLEKLAADPDTMPDAEGLVAALRPDLLKLFRPAFLGRVTVVPYLPLSPDVLREIVVLALGRLAVRVRESFAAELVWDEAVIDAVAARCTEAQSGARNVEAVIQGTIAPDLAARILSARQDGAECDRIRLRINGSGAIEIAFDALADAASMQQSESGLGDCELIEETVHAGVS